MRPEEAGTAFGVEQPESYILSLGYKSLPALRAETVSGPMVAIGKFNMPEVQSDRTTVSSNYVLSSDFLTGPADRLSLLAGNVIVGSQAAPCEDTERIESNIVVAPVESFALAGFYGQKTLRNNIVLMTGETTWTKKESAEMGTAIVANGRIYEIGHRATVLSAGGLARLREADDQILVSSGRADYEGSGHNDVAAIQGARACSATEDSQVVFSHASMRLQHMEPTSPATAEEFNYLYRNPRDGVVRAAAASCCVRRVFSAQVSTDANGYARLDLRHLRLVSIPHAQATVIHPSANTVFFIKTVSVSSEEWVGRLFRLVLGSTVSMRPAPQDILADVMIAY